ncbi:uncharacterized protein [Asterias amurensis]|uniref:uncharacterized protein isoform X1 n=1 Tax=Asterias amurensis TaxID=7602 RepID=UPI003AB4D060
MGKLSYFLVAVTAAVTVGAFWFNRRQEDENNEKEIIEKESDVDSGLPGHVADMLHGGAFSKVIKPKTNDKKNAIKMARKELKDNPMEAMGDARELLQSIRAPHPAVYFNMVDDGAEEPPEPELPGMVPGGGPGFVVLNSDQFLDNVPQELQEQILAEQMALFHQGVPLN